MTITTPPIIEQTNGFQFDSNNFAMTFANTGTTLVQHQTVSMTEWENEGEDEEEEIIIEVEVDPDLEDGEDEDFNPNNDEPDDINDDDGFEQYLFGEDDD